MCLGQSNDIYLDNVSVYKSFRSTKVTPVASRHMWTDTCINLDNDDEEKNVESIRELLRRYAQYLISVYFGGKFN